MTRKTKIPVWALLLALVVLVYGGGLLAGVVWYLRNLPRRDRS